MSGQKQLLFLHFLHAGLVGNNQSWAVCIDQSIHKLIGLAIELVDLPLNRFLVLLNGLFLGGPKVFEHFKGRFKQADAGFQLFQQRFEFPFQLVAPNGFAVVIAAFGLAEIVRILPVATFRPRRRQRLVAAGAGDEATKREVFSLMSFRAGA
nr:hypothetical protein [Ruegeria sp. PrR005]